MELNFFYTNLILVPAVAFITTVVLKFFSIYLKTKKFDIKRAIGSGGMPSSHSAIVSSLATSIFLIHGIFSEPFAVVTTFTIIIIYDAINVRYEAGLHAKAINNILGKKATNKMLGRDKLKESLGHLPSEAFAGVVVGMIVAFILYII